MCGVITFSLHLIVTSFIRLYIVIFFSYLNHLCSSLFIFLCLFLGFSLVRYKTFFAFSLIFLSLCYSTFLYKCMVSVFFFTFTLNIIIYHLLSRLPSLTRPLRQLSFTRPLYIILSPYHKHTLRLSTTTVPPHTLFLVLYSDKTFSSFVPSVLSLQFHVRQE